MMGLKIEATVEERGVRHRVRGAMEPYVSIQYVASWGPDRGVDGAETNGELAAGWWTAQTEQQWDVAGDEAMTEKHFKVKNATLSVCIKCGEKVKSTIYGEMKNHIVKKCLKQ